MQLNLSTGDLHEGHVEDYPKIHDLCPDGGYMNMADDIVAYYRADARVFLWFKGKSYQIPKNAKATRRRLTDDTALFSLFADGREVAALEYQLPDLSLFEYPYDVLIEPEFEDFFLYLHNAINDGRLFREKAERYRFGDFLSAKKESLWSRIKRALGANKSV